MRVLWIPLLAILILFHQTSMGEKSSVRDRTMMAAPAGGSDTTEVIGAVGGSVTFRINSPDRNAALWSYEDDAIVTVPFEDPVDFATHNDKFKDRFAVSEKGRALTISQLRMEDAGTYSAKINGKTSTFILQVFRELAEPTVTCEVQNCSGGSCSSSLRCSVPGVGFGKGTAFGKSIGFVEGVDFGNVSYTWNVGDQLLAEGPVLLVNESHLDMQEPLMCTAGNPVSNRNSSVTTPGALCSGADSGNPVWIPVIAGIGICVLVFILLIFLAFRCKSKVSCVKERLRGRDGRRGDSHGAAGDIDAEAEVFV